MKGSRGKKGSGTVPSVRDWSKGGKGSKSGWGQRTLLTPPSPQMVVPESLAQPIRSIEMRAVYPVYCAACGCLGYADKSEDLPPKWRHRSDGKRCCVSCWGGATSSTSGEPVCSGDTVTIKFGDDEQ